MPVIPPHPLNPPYRRILIVRPSALGDVCRTVPVLVSLKRAFPDARIDWLVQDSFAPAIARHPDLSAVIPFHRHRLGAWHRPKVIQELWTFLHSIRRTGYDLVLDCQGLARSALFTRATGAPVRIGFANAAEMGWLALTQRVSAPRSMHTVDRMLRLAAAAGCEPVADLRLYTAPDDRAKVESSFALTRGTYAVLAPTTRWPGKLWPEDRFRELTRRLLETRTSGIERVVVVGSAAERGQCGALTEFARNDPRVLDLVGRSSVGELLALIEGSRLVVGSDSAAIHIAVGFNRPLVALYGPTRVELVGPYGRTAHVVQHLLPGDRPDHKNEAAGRLLMSRITVQEVLDCALLQLAKPFRPAPSLAPPDLTSPRASVAAADG